MWLFQWERFLYYVLEYKQDSELEDFPEMWYMKNLDKDDKKGPSREIESSQTKEYQIVYTTINRTKEMMWNPSMYLVL